MKIYRELEQNTPEWMQVRLGKFTASDCYAIGTAGSGKGKDGLETLCLEKASEILTGQLPEMFTNEDVERGHQLEQEARISYELETGRAVEQVGFIEVNEFVGCSPDGLVEEDGLVEFKAKNNKNHLIALLGKIDIKYQWQMQFQMLCLARNWCDFVSFNPNYSKAPNIKIVRVYKDDEMQDALKRGLDKGINRIKEILEKVKVK